MESAETKVRSRCPEVTILCDEEMFRIHKTASGMPTEVVIGEGETPEKAWETAAENLGIPPEPGSCRHLKRVNLH